MVLRFIYFSYSCWYFRCFWSGSTYPSPQTKPNILANKQIAKEKKNQTNVSIVKAVEGK